MPTLRQGNDFDADLTTIALTFDVNHRNLKFTYSYQASGNAAKKSAQFKKRNKLQLKNSFVSSCLLMEKNQRRENLVKSDEEHYCVQKVSACWFWTLIWIDSSMFGIRSPSCILGQMIHHLFPCNDAECNFNGNLPQQAHFWEFAFYYI